MPCEDHFQDSWERSAYPPPEARKRFCKTLFNRLFENQTEEKADALIPKVNLWIPALLL
jgi:hypothetical protein